MKFAIKEVVFNEARGFLNGRAWFADVKQGGVQSIEFDDATSILTLDAPTKKIRIPLTGVAEMVYGPTLAANKSG